LPNFKKIVYYPKRGINMEAVEFGTNANNGIIEIPIEYRKDFSTDIKVILIKNNRNANTESNIQERMEAAQRLAGIISENTMTLDEIRNERLSRQ